MLKKIILAMVITMLTTTLVLAQTAEDIIRKMDKMRAFETMFSQGSMISVDRFGEKKSTYKAWQRGTQDSLIEFTNIEEQGQKVLKSGDQLYLFYPDADEVIPMNGAALKQSLFGDISYEDLTEDRNTLNSYSVSLKGSEVLEGVDCWVIEMIARKKSIAYPKQILKVNKANNILKGAEYYAKSGRLIKIVKVLAYKEYDGFVVITDMELADQLRKKSTTRMLIEDVKINPKLKDELFSLESLY